MRVLLFALAAAALWATPATSAHAPSPAGHAPAARALSSCSDYLDQAAAQKAGDTRDGDGDGVYCESLPCPCSSSSGTGAPPATAAAPAPSQPACTRPIGVQYIGFSKTKYPTIYAHFQAAVKRGWPQILAVNRPYIAARRARALRDIPTREGQDRDEYPPAIGRGKYRNALMRGTRPRGWMTDVAYVPSSENRSQGSTLGIKLRRFCNGTRFRYRFY